LEELAIQAMSPRGKQILLTSPRGAGYWVWKSLVIWQTLLDAADGDIVMYADAATEFIAGPSPLFQLAEQQNVVGFWMPYQEADYTKRDTFIVLDAEGLSSSHQLLASFVVF
jgi:hypothetical protein